MVLLLMSHYITRHILRLISTTIIFTLHAINFRFRYLVYLQFAVDASRIEVDAPHRTNVRAKTILDDGSGDFLNMLQRFKLNDYDLTSIGKGAFTFFSTVKRQRNFCTAWNVWNIKRKKDIALVSKK